MMKRLHVVSDKSRFNGMFVAAEMLARDVDGEVITCAEFLAMENLDQVPEVVVHGCWLPCYWKCCLKTLRAKIPLGRMTHANLDPLRYRFHGWKKRLVSPVERWLFKKSAYVIVTCDEEEKWCRQWGVKGPFEMVDLKKHFNLNHPVLRPQAERTLTPLHVLYMGRVHPLKGVAYLEKAAERINALWRRYQPVKPLPIELKIVTNAEGEEKEAALQWCDVLCLPTLSENFGLVVGEAIEHGCSVITTDGAPAWRTYFDANPDHGMYLSPYRSSTPEERIDLLQLALKKYVD